MARNTFGMKAKAAIVAGAMALTLVPTTALAATTTQTNQFNQRAPMAQSFNNQGQQQNQGQMLEGERPELPEGVEAPAEGEMPEIIEGELPEMPEGQMLEGERPELPEGVEAPAEGEMPEITEGERPELPEGVEAPAEGEMPQGQMTEGQAPNGEMPEGQAPNGQMTEGENGEQGPVGFMKSFIQKLANLFGVDVEESAIEEMLSGFNFMQQGQQAPQQGQQGQQAPQQGQQA